MQHGLEGEVYIDHNAGGKIDGEHYLKTTPAEDQKIKTTLDAEVGEKGAYLPWSTCRDYSQNEYDKIKGEYGEETNPPERKSDTDQPSSAVPPISSTVTSSEPHGPTSNSGSSNSGFSTSESTTTDKIICAELFRQGLMDKTIYKADEEFGTMLRKKYFITLVGYQAWARPTVKFMKRSKNFTQLVYYIAKPWTYEMAI